jgi:hypothetical protein
MSIKYGEITIIHNSEADGFIKSIFREWGGYEFKTQESSQIVILFEDGEICEINDKLKDFEYKFLTNISSPIPSYFEKNIENDKYKNIYFYKSPETNDKGQLRISFENLFKSYTIYSKNNTVPSTYNFIYYCHKPNAVEIFGIVRLKSSETKPRFLFAYDKDEFSKEEVIYLINYIFKNKIED